MYLRNDGKELLDFLLTVFVVLGVICLFIWGIITAKIDARDKDRRKRVECVEMGGVVVPSSDDWSCALQSAPKLER